MVNRTAEDILILCFLDTLTNIKSVTRLTMINLENANELDSY